MSSVGAPRVRRYIRECSLAVQFSVESVTCLVQGFFGVGVWAVAAL